LFAERTEIADRRDAGQESVGPAPGANKARQTSQSEGVARFEHDVEPAGFASVGADQGFVGAGHARILQADIDPIGTHRLELGPETGTDEIAEQPALGSIS